MKLRPGALYKPAVMASITTTQKKSVTQYFLTLLYHFSIELAKIYACIKMNLGERAVKKIKIKINDVTNYGSAQ